MVGKPFRDRRFKKLTLVDDKILIFHSAKRCEVNYFQPKKTIRLDSGPILLGTSGSVVVKTSWSEEVRRRKEAAMHRASNGQFGTIPRVFV